MSHIIDAHGGGEEGGISFLRFMKSNWIQKINIY
jgi:hypothetical protein